MRITIILSILLLTGCTFQNNTDSDKTISLEEYKEKNKWIELDDWRKYVIKPFSKLGIDSMTYNEALLKNGIPVLEYNDTVVKGLNIKTGKPDFDIYPLTMDRDTVTVLRCWWMKSFNPIKMLYIVFETNTDITEPIYGYLYNPDNMPHDNYSHWLDATSR